MRFAHAFAFPSGQQAGGGAAPPAPPDNLTSFEGLIASRCGRRGTLVAGKEFNARTVYKSSDAIHSLKVAFENLTVANNAPSEVATGTNLRIYASVEYPAGTFTQITWSGVDHLDLASGDLQISDYTAGDINIPAATDFWIRTFESSTNGQGYLANAAQNTARGELFETGNTGTLTNKTMGGTITASTTSSAPAIAVIGVSTKPSVIGLGDSKMFLGLAGSVSASNAGFVGEIFSCFSDETIPFLNLGRPGGQAQNFDGFFVKEKALLGFSSDYVNEFAINDFFTGGLTAAQVKAANEAIIAEINVAHPHAKIMMSTVGPKATSATGAWIGGADQTTNGSNGDKNVYNAIVRASGIIGQNNGFGEVAWNLEASHDSGTFRTHPTLFRTVTDAAITVGTNTLTSATANFTNADIGLGVGITGAGAAGVMRVSTITSVTNSTTVKTLDNAQTTVSGATCYIGQLSIDGLHEQPAALALLAAAGAVPVADFVFPATKPRPFSFAAHTNALPSTVYTSAAITVTGTMVASPMTISGGSGQYQINGGAWASAATTVNPGDTVAVRGTSSGSFVTEVDVILTIGGVSGTFAITTQSAFGFVDEIAAGLSTVYTSNTVTLVAGGAISVSGGSGQYQVNGGGWTSSPGTVSASDTVAVRGTSSGSVSTGVNVTLTVGADSDTYTITTVANSEASAFILRITADPGAARRQLMDTLVGSLKVGATSGSNIWGKLDVIHVYAAKDQQSAALNWKGTSYTAVPDATHPPTFTVDTGYKGNGSNQFIDEGFSDDDVAGNWSQNSAHLGVYVNNVGTTTTAVIGTFTNQNTRILPITAGTFATRLHGSGISSTPVATARGDSVADRSASGAFLKYRDGVVSGTNQGTASGAPPAEHIFALKANLTFSDVGIALTRMGGHLTAAENADENAAFVAYLTALGAN